MNGIFKATQANYATHIGAINDYDIHGCTIQNSSSTVYPNVDKAFAPVMGYSATYEYLSLGCSNHKWSEVYASNGSIITSDRNTKENIHIINELYENLFMNLKPVTFKRTGRNRTHIGYISQDV